jgi:glycosyltransferase involved in cell wall biosynthesis
MRTDMRLVIVNSSRRWCGVDQVCRALSLGMRARGHEVLNAVRPDSDYREALDREGLQWIGVPDRSPTRLLTEWRRYISAVRTFAPDLTHIHTGADWASALFMPRSASSVTVATRHNGYSIGRTKARLYRHRFDRVFAVSEFVRRVLVEEDGFESDQVDILANPLTIQIESRDAARQRFAAEVHEDRDQIARSAPSQRSGSEEESTEPFRVGFIGRYSHGKGIDVVHSLARRLEGDRDVRFYTAGRPAGARAQSLMHTLSRDQPRNLVDLGFITDLGGFYAFVDVTLMPTTRQRREAAGLTALEGQAMGTPVIVNDSGALPDSITHGLNGFVVEDNDVDAFARHIRELRDDPELLLRMANAGREHAKRWEAESVLDEHERVYLETLIS